MARLARPDMTLVQLRYFVTAATRRSMTEASVDLHVAQSAVSTAIAQLERGLGVQLFVRQRSKGLALTDAGEQLLRDARSLLAQVDEMTDTVRGRHYDVRGTLRLAVPRFGKNAHQAEPGQNAGRKRSIDTARDDNVGATRRNRLAGVVDRIRGARASGRNDVTWTAQLKGHGNLAGK